MDKTQKAVLLRYLNQARDAMVWKLDGLSEYDMRRPMTPTGTNLLGLVKHLALVELGYFGDTFDRPHGEKIPSAQERQIDPFIDLVASPTEASADILSLYQRARAHSDVTISALDLDAEGRVPWWPDTINPVPLHLIMAHMTTETHRHVGHADIIRELIDGTTGHRQNTLNMPVANAEFWSSHRQRVEDAARAAEQAQ